MKRRRSYAFSHLGAHFCLRGGCGEEGKFDVAARSETPKPSCQSHKQQTCCDRALAQVKQHIHEPPGWKKSKYWANIEKRKQINSKNYWKYERRLCVKLFKVTNTTWENLKIATHKSVKCAEWMTLLCALRFAYFLRLCSSPRTTSRTISLFISNSFGYYHLLHPSSVRPTLWNKAGSTSGSLSCWPSDFSLFLTSLLLKLTFGCFLFYCSFFFFQSQLNGWRLFNVTSFCLASRLSRGATINTISSDFFDQSLLFPLTRAANRLNILRSQNQSELSVNQVRRAMFCGIINHFQRNKWKSQKCNRLYETALPGNRCAQCTPSKPK